MGIKIDFTNVENTTFEPLPTGTYTVIVTGVEQRDSKSSEYPYLNWELVVSEGEFENRKLWVMTSLSPKAAFKLKETMIAFGATDTDGEFDLEPEDYIGASCSAVVIVENYQGKQVNRVSNLLPIGSSTNKSANKPASKSASGKPKLV